jgi:GTP-binding protein LepA
MRTVSEAQVGDTLCRTDSGTDGVPLLPLASFAPARQHVFAGVFPVSPQDYDTLRGSIEQLALNDPSTSLEADMSPALGNGWRMGFLGLLHLEVRKS